MTNTSEQNSQVVSNFGHLKNLLLVSFPIIISQSCDSLMMFTDRYLLSSLGTVYPAASLVGGVTSFLIAIPFVGILSYTNPLIGQYFGAKQHNAIPNVVHQGILLSIVCFPIILLLAFWFGPVYFKLLEIPSQEFVLALEYYNIINLGVVFLLIKIAISGFFTGIGNTKVIMFFNFLGLLANVPVSYFLIKNGFGVKGAAFGTVFSEFFIALLFIIAWLRNPHCKKTPWFNWDILKKLIRYGTPSGLEFFIIMFVFNTFLNLFHSYGPIEAFSITIALNWELLIILPLVGLNIGVMSQVGNAMGAENIPLAKKITQSGIILGISFVFLSGIILLCGTHTLIELFKPDTLGVLDESTWPTIVNLTTFLIQLMPFYLFFDAMNLVLSGTLRAAGDTRYCLYVSLLGQTSCLMLGQYLKLYHGLNARYLWLIFVFSIGFQTFFLIRRYRKGSWQKIQVIEH